MKNIGGYLAVYPACYEPNMGAEYARFPSYEGFPVCNLKPEEYLAEHLKRVAIKVIVTG